MKYKKGKIYRHSTKYGAVMCTKDSKYGDTFEGTCIEETRDNVVGHHASFWYKSKFSIEVEIKKIKKVKIPK
jgi:hypothetical protein